MKKITSLVILLLVIFTAQTFAQATIEHGREFLKATVNFRDIAEHERLHPSPLVRKRIMDEDNEVRPDALPADPLMIFRDHPTTRRALGPHSAFLPVSPSPADTFLSTITDGTSIPPDTHGAVDSQYCLTMINTAFTIQNRTGTTVSSVTLDAFWNAVLPGGPGSFDPRIHWDPLSHRWITAVLAYGQTSTAQLMVGASVTADPTGAWHLYAIIIDGTGANWLDFENVGFNKNYIVIAGNPFSNSSGASLGATVYVFDKASILSGAGAPYVSFNEPSSFTICPALTYDTAESSLYMMEDYSGSSPGGGQMQLWRVSGPVAAPSVTSMGFPTSSLQWEWQSNDFSGTAGADFAPQVGTANKIQTNDGRVNNCVERNGKVWCAHNVFLPYSTSANATRCSVMWWEIDTSGTIDQNGLIDDPTNTNFYYFPSIAVNKNNDALIGYSMSSRTIHPDCMYSLRLAADPVDSVRPKVIYRHGQNTYSKPAGFGGTRNRWGDYSATQVDPTNDTDFWTIQECVEASPANTWDTWWAHIVLCNTPNAPSAASIPTACTGLSGAYSVAPVSGATVYSWTVTGTSWSGSSTTNTINITAGTGIATVAVTAGSSCGISSQYIFTVSPSAAPVKPVITPPTSIPCGATALTYTATSTGATSYSWTVIGAGWSGSSSTGTLGATSAVGTGTIIATGVNACGNSISDTVVSTVPPGTVPATPVASVVPTAPCSGTSPTFDVGPVTGATSYTWTVSGAGWSGSSSAASATLTVGTATGTISVTATSACGTSAALVLTVTPTNTPGAPVITAPTIPCGATSGTYTATSTGASSYSWTVAGSGWSGSSASSTVVVTLGTGTGTITASAANACGSASTAITTTAPVAVPLAPTAGTAPSAPCAGSSASYSVTPSVGATSYNWTITGTGWSGSSTTNIITLTAGTGVATISVTAANGCGSSAAYVFTVNPATSSLPTPAIAVPSLPCGGTGTTTCTAAVTGAVTYGWLVLGTGWSGSSTTGTVIITVGTGTGTVICTAYNACATSAPDTVTITPAAAAPAGSTSIFTPTPVCSGNYEVFSTSVIPTASSYNWSVSGTGWSGSSTTNTITFAVGTGPATISVWGLNGCGGATPYSILVTPIHTPQSSFTIRNHVTIPSAVDSIFFTGTGYLATFYAWSFGPAGFASPGTGFGPEGVHWTTTGLKSVILTVSDSGCSTTYTDTVLVVSSLNLPELSSKNPDFNVIPNPSTGNFEIEFNKSVNKAVEVRILDMAGREVYFNSYDALSNNKVAVESQGLISGTYIVTVTIDGDVSARTITIQK